MNILYIGHEANDWVVSICNEIANQGHNVTCVIQDSVGYKKQIIKNDNLKIVYLSYDELMSFEKSNKVLDDLINSNNFNFIFGSHITSIPMTINAAVKHNIPSGIMILDMPVDLINKEQRRKDVWNSLIPFMNEADLIITNTEICNEELNKFLDKEPNPENIIIYPISTPEEFKDSHIKGEYVISVCRLTQMKNCILIPKALKGTNISYIAVGSDGGQVKEIEKYCNDNNIVFKYVGMVSEKDKFKLISNALVLVYPQNSEYIGGLSPYEAMWCGTPAIVPDLGIYRSLYEDNVTYFTNNDEKDLKEKILSISTYNNRSEYVEKVASYKTFVNKLLKRIEETCKNTY